MENLKYCPMHKVVSLEYPLREGYYTKYLLKDEIQEEVRKYFEKFGLIDFENFGIDFNTGISGSFCYLEFPWEMSDEKIKTVCEKVIDFLNDENFIDKEWSYIV